MKKLRVGVLMGGKSIEQEVSFNSGRTICDHLDSARYEIIPLFQSQTGQLYILPWRFLHRGKIADFHHRLSTQATTLKWDELKLFVDFIYIALHGRFAEDGTIQGFLEVLGIPYVGSKVFASALRADKAHYKLLLSSEGINVPKGIVVTPTETNSIDERKQAILAALDAKNISFPLIVKPHKEGSSLGISVVHHELELWNSIKKASTATQGIKQSVLVEEKINGMEFTCIILTDYKTGNLLPLPPTEIVLEAGKEFYDYEQKYMPGRSLKFTPARCSLEQQAHIKNISIQVMKIMGLTNCARIDGFLTHDNKIVITDVNSLSGMAPSSFIFRQAAEINMGHTQLINHIIETELHRYNMLESIINEEQKTMQKTEQKKINVAVLFGGDSNEKEISLESGRNIVYKLSPQKYIPIPVFVSNKMELYRIDQSLLVSNSTKEIVSALSPEMKINWSDLSSIADFVFIALHGGKGENGCVQGTLEMLGIPYNGSSVFTSALCMDKFQTTQFLKKQGFEVPQSSLIALQEWFLLKNNQLMEHQQFPLIVKPHDDGCSTLVFKVHTSSELQEALGALHSAGKAYAMVEEYIKGMELTVGVVGNSKIQALVPSQTISSKGILSLEEKFLPGAGENQTPAPLSAETLQFIQKTIENAYQILDCKGYARIDCFYQSALESPSGQERVIILEVNTLPGMTPATCIFHQAAELEIKPMDFIDLIISLGLEEHAHSSFLPDPKNDLLSLQHQIMS